jgi:hypothetical protein
MFIMCIGSHTKGKKNILLEMQEAHEAQSLSIQEGQGLSEGLGQEKI